MRPRSWNWQRLVGARAYKLSALQFLQVGTQVVSGQPARLASVAPHAEVVPARDIHAGPFGFVGPAVLLLAQRLGKAERSEVFVRRVIDQGHALTAREGRSVCGHLVFVP